MKKMAAVFAATDFWPPDRGDVKGRKKRYIERLKKRFRQIDGQEQPGIEFFDP